jgi:hypothetical protein
MTLLDEYRERAAVAAREAEAATSEGVRHRCRQVETAMLAAAERVERSLARRADRLGS